MDYINWFIVVGAIIFSRNIRAQDPQILGRLLSPKEGCGISKATNAKIVGGTETKPGAYPWMALIGYSSSNEIYFECGGSLITSRHVLTAAHCITPHLKFVRLAEHDLSTTSDGEHQDINVTRLIRHPKFNDEFIFANDVAILTLEHDVKFNDRIRPICLPLTEELQSKSFVGTNPFVAGWGRLQENGDKSEVLMHVQLPVIEYAKCEPFAHTIYRFWGKIPLHQQFTSAVICAGNLNGGEDACTEDSGGPLMLPILENSHFQMYQIGIVSSGIGCARKDSSGLYARVQNYIDWIKDEVNKK